MESYSSSCNFPDICCDKPEQEKTCEQMSGTICNSSQECSISEVSALDTEHCCTGTCEEKNNNENPNNKPECELNSGVCRVNQCLNNETTSDYSCLNNEYCCIPNYNNPPTSHKGKTLLYVLILLIILVGLGIVFKEKLKVLLAKLRYKFHRRGSSGNPINKNNPKFPPSSGMRRIQPRFRPRTNTKEIDDVLKKLKEMSK